MNREEAEPQFRRMMDEYQAEAHAAYLAIRRREAVAQMLIGYVELFPEFRNEVKQRFPTLRLPTPVENPAPVAAAKAPTHRPKGTAAVKRVMGQRPKERFTVQTMVDELTALQLLPDSERPSAAVRTALERLVASGDVNKETTEDRGVLYSLRIGEDRRS